MGTSILSPTPPLRSRWNSAAITAYAAVMPLALSAMMLRIRRGSPSPCIGAKPLIAWMTMS